MTSDDDDAIQQKTSDVSARYTVAHCHEG